VSEKVPRPRSPTTQRSTGQKGRLLPGFYRFTNIAESCVMERRKFINALPLAVGGAIAITMTDANAQTQGAPAVQVASNIAALRLLSGTSSPCVIVEGYISAGDGGGGIFFCNLSDTTSPDNGATIFVSSSGSRYYRLWDGGQFNVLWAGADKTGMSSSDAAFARASAITAVLYIPKGRYRLENVLELVVPSGNEAITITGDGMEQSILYFPTNAGINVTYQTTGGSNSVSHIRDISITAGKASLGSALSLNYSSATGVGMGFTDVTNVRIRGDDGINSFFWVNGIAVNGVSSINFNGVVITSSASFTSGGNGIVLQGNAIGSIVYNVNACILDFLQNAMIYGDYIQGVTVNNTNMTNCVNGIVVFGGQTGLDQLTVTGCQFDTTTYNILSQSLLGNVQIANNLLGFRNPTGIAVYGEFTTIAITGNSINGQGSSGGNGIVITSGTTGIVSGNAFANLETGVWLQQPTSYFNVQSNCYNGVTNPAVNNGVNNQLGGGSV